MKSRFFFDLMDRSDILAVGCPQSSISTVCYGWLVQQCEAGTRVSLLDKPAVALDAKDMRFALCGSASLRETFTRWPEIIAEFLP